MCVCVFAFSETFEGSIRLVFFSLLLLLFKLLLEIKFYVVFSIESEFVESVGNRFLCISTERSVVDRVVPQLGQLVMTDGFTASSNVNNTGKSQPLILIWTCVLSQ